LGANSVGNLNVRLKVWTPKKITSEQKRLFTELAEHEDDGPDEGGPSFWNRLKEALGA
jgi:DnaJ-class molecular chaperone